MLAAIEREVADPSFVVVGVHSPKFPGQRDPEMVRAAVRRLGVAHPTVLDPDLEIARAFAVRGWPTMVFVDPRGYVAGVGKYDPASKSSRGLLAEKPDFVSTPTTIILLPLR